jgi:hypothetical protein
MRDGAKATAVVVEERRWDWVVPTESRWALSGSSRAVLALRVEDDLGSVVGGRGSLAAMAPKVPICPYGHLTRVEPAVVVLAVGNVEQARRIGGYRMKPRMRSGVDVHCTECHLEGWISVGPDWNLSSWTGPTQCSCGVSSDRH